MNQIIIKIIFHRYLVIEIRTINDDERSAGDIPAGTTIPPSSHHRQRAVRATASFLPLPIAKATSSSSVDVVQPRSHRRAAPTPPSAQTTSRKPAAVANGVARAGFD